MILTDGQKRMYEGEYGPGTQKAITMLVEYGDVWDADGLVRVNNAHTGLSGGDWLRMILEGVEQVRTYTTTHAGMTGANRQARDMGLKEDFCRQQAKAQSEVLDLCISKGFIPAMTCAPYMVGNVPTAGNVFSWPGSSGIPATTRGTGQLLPGLSSLLRPASGENFPGLLFSFAPLPWQRHLGVAPR